MASNTDDIPQDAHIDVDDPEQLDETPTVTITIHHHGKPTEISLPEGSTLSDLSEHLSAHLSILPSHQKFMITPKIGLLKPPFSTKTNHPLSTLADKKIVFLGSTTAEI